MTAEMNKKPPYYAVIFSARRAEGDHGYSETAERMQELAASMPGYIGFESARNDDGFGIAISYWDSEEAMKNWKNQSEHLAAQKRGRETWYKDYHVRVAKVEREYTDQGGRR